MAANNNINLKKKERVKITKSFAAPDKDTFTFVFVKSKFGCLRVAQFVCMNIFDQCLLCTSINYA